MVIPSNDTRPREERDYKEVYPDLDETAQLAVFTIHEENSLSLPKSQSPAGSSNLNNSRPNTSTNTANGVSKPPKFTTRRRSLAALHLSRLPRLVAEYGFRLRPHKQKSPSTYIREYSQPKPTRQVMYDMDEQDSEYLEWRNTREENLAVILPEVFEIVMSVLEEQWQKLEVQMAAVGNGPGNSSDQLLTLDENFDKYGSDDGIGGVGSIFEQRCAVCNDLECDNTNAIVFCDGCNIAVHQECYGIAFIPEGQWFCRRCMLSRGRSVDCTFCPSHTGAFKQLDNGLWSHVVCALWIHEVYFANPIYLEPIEGIDMIPRNRWKLVCYICKQKTGACVQCTNRNCFQAYHVTCAKRAGLYMVMEKGMQGALASKATLKSFCDRHGPLTWSREAVLHGITKTRMFYRDSRLLLQQNDRLVLQRRQQNRFNTFKWRTENNTPIAPQKFVDVVFSTMLQLKVETTAGEFQPATSSSILRGLGHKIQMTKKDIYDDLRTASASLCRYWCLKREAKGGAPLVRPSASNPILVLAASMYEASASELGVGPELAHRQLEEKIQFGHTLMNDLRKVIELAQTTRYRQVVAHESTKLQLTMADTAYFPLKAVAARVLSHICDKIDSLRLIANERPKAETLALPDIMSKVAAYRYTTVDELDNDIQGLLTQILREHKGSSAIGKTATRALNYWRDVGRNDVVEIAACAKADIPFVQIKGFDFALKPYNPAAVLAEEQLSEVEEDAFTTNDNQILWRRFLSESQSSSAPNL